MWKSNSKAGSKPGFKAGSRTGKLPWGRQWLPYLAFIFVGFAIADLLIISYRDLMLPTQAPPPRPPQMPPLNNAGMGAYDSIIARNIFSSTGIIPDPLQMKNDPNNRETETPILSSLPLTLIGTLVHSNPEKSIAAIEVKSKNQILSFTPKHDIENIATVEKVERGKVFIRNTNNGQLEYIELKSDNKVAFGGSTKAPETAKGEVGQTGNNQFELKRAVLLKYTSDLSSVLMQARCVPATRPGTGEVYGFRCVEIQPGSIYTQLGMRPMDVICGVNGSPVTSAQQAMELYSTLRNSNKIELCIERDGKASNFSYTISQ